MWLLERLFLNKNFLFEAEKEKGPGPPLHVRSLQEDMRTLLYKGYQRQFSGSTCWPSGIKSYRHPELSSWCRKQSSWRYLHNMDFYGISSPALWADWAAQFWLLSLISTYGWVKAITERHNT